MLWHILFVLYLWDTTQAHAHIWNILCTMARTYSTKSRYIGNCLMSRINMIKSSKYQTFAYEIIQTPRHGASYLGYRSNANKLLSQMMTYIKSPWNALVLLRLKELHIQFICAVCIHIPLTFFNASARARARTLNSRLWCKMRAPAVRANTAIPPFPSSILIKVIATAHEHFR